MSTIIHDQQLTSESSVSRSAAPAPATPAPEAYEPPCLTPAGNLLDLLGKSGLLVDYVNRRPHATRP